METERLPACLGYYDLFFLMLSIVLDFWICISKLYLKAY